jgi:hypothetical protein
MLVPNKLLKVSFEESHAIGELNAVVLSICPIKICKPKLSEALKVIEHVLRGA